VSLTLRLFTGILFLPKYVEPKPQEPCIFAFSKPEMECHPVPGPDLDPDPTLNGIQKSKSNKKTKTKMTTFWETMLLLTLTRHDFVQIFCCS
jgi:hypothetical protein